MNRPTDLPLWRAAPRKRRPRTCPHCGAKMVEYRHSLNAGLVTALRRLRDAGGDSGASGGGEANLADLGLTRNQWDNFQKLRYFDLVEQVEVDGRRKRGVWRVTERGRDWLDGAIRVPMRAVTYRGERVAYEGPAVTPNDLSPGFAHRETYAAEARPHIPRSA